MAVLPVGQFGRLRETSRERVGDWKNGVEVCAFSQRCAIVVFVDLDENLFLVNLRSD